jgi:hypothetical protein
MRAGLRAFVNLEPDDCIAAENRNKPREDAANRRWSVAGGQLFRGPVLRLEV